MLITSRFVCDQLNDVERGGSTAFPRAGVAVSPVRGGAAFWYNLKRNGLGNPNTLHGACPVLLGHKWGEQRDFTQLTNLIIKFISLIKIHFENSQQQMDPSNSTDVQQRLPTRSGRITQRISGLYTI